MVSLLSQRFASSPVTCMIQKGTHEWMKMQMLAKPCSSLLQRTGGDHRGGRAQPGWRTFMMTCLCWILGYMRLEIWHKTGLSADWRLHGDRHSYWCILLLVHTEIQGVENLWQFWLTWEEPFPPHTHRQRSKSANHQHHHRSNLFMQKQDW